MSAYLVDFSTSIIAPLEAIDWLEKKLSGEFDQDNPDWAGALCDFERSAESPTKMFVWTENPQDCDEESLVEAVCDMQERFDLADPWHLELSFHFSGRGAEFHTGVAICYKGKYTFLTSSDYAKGYIDKMLKGGVESDHAGYQSLES